MLMLQIKILKQFFGFYLLPKYFTILVHLLHGNKLLNILLIIQGKIPKIYRNYLEIRSSTKIIIFTKEFF